MAVNTYNTTRMPRWLSHIALGIIYNPPKSDDRATTDHINNCIDEITGKHPYAGLIVRFQSAPRLRAPCLSAQADSYWVDS